MKNYRYLGPVQTAGQLRHWQGGASLPSHPPACQGRGHGRLRDPRALPKVMRPPREVPSPSPAGEYAAILLNDHFSPLTVLTL